MAQLHLHLHHSLFKTNLTHSSSSPPPPSSSTKPNIIIMTQKSPSSYWDSIYSDINSHLKQSIQIRDPITVFEPMHHLTFATPKTTASALCVAACEVVGGNRDDAIVVASAIHLMHATRYIHDHLLLSDSKPESETRIAHRFESNIELLTGDGIMPFGFELLARSAGNDSEKILKVIIEIAQAMGTHEMVNEELDRSGAQLSRELHGRGAACGAIMGGGSGEEINRLKRYGVFVGKIQGLVADNSESEGAKIKLLEWSDLALKELLYFDSKKIEKIASIVKFA